MAKDPPDTAEAIPLLEPGDRLTREEFERRYDAMPGVKKAELIDGVVYMPSPVRHRRHSRPHSWLGAWLTLYSQMTPGVDSGDNGSLRLDVLNEPQPDLYLLIQPECGGQARISADDYVEHAPELVAEVSASTVSIDLHSKRDLYLRTGVREYIVWRVIDAALDWFILRDERFERLDLGPDGLHRSVVFPGLWVDPVAILAGDGPRNLAVLQQGLASPEHAAFVQRLRTASTAGS
jgi:Uma2 family endonuclease